MMVLGFVRDLAAFLYGAAIAVTGFFILVATVLVIAVIVRALS